MNVRYGSEIAAAAAAHHLDPRLLAAVAAQETGGPGSDSGNNIVGDAGHGRGVFQIDDRSWSFARTPAAMDPGRNADMAASILTANLQRYGGDVHAALSAYNAGSPTARGTATTWGDGATLGYADSVLRHYTNLGGETQARLVADSRETSTGVNALATYGASRAPAPSPSPSPSQALWAPSPAVTQMPSYAPALQTTTTMPPAPGSIDAAGADADSRLATIVSGDESVEGTDGSDDADVSNA